MRVWRLETLTDDDVATVVRRAIDDEERGLAGALGPTGGVALSPEAFDHLISLAGGDARAALNVLEGATALAESEEVRDADGHVSPRLEDVESAAQQRVLAYDRAGDGHYDTVSAFIKSLRGNDPDAALYWLAAMIAAGEDPKFIARRLIISASEDVGNADPRALQVAVAAGQALDWIGLPEAQYALAQATRLRRRVPEVESGRRGLRRGHGRRHQPRLPAGPEAPPIGDRPAAPRHGRRRRLPLSTRLRGSRRRPAVPARPAARTGPALLPSHRTRGSSVGSASSWTVAVLRRASGRPKRVPQPGSDPMAGMGDGMKAHTEARKKLAETQKRDAGT